MEQELRKRRANGSAPTTATATATTSAEATAAGEDSDDVIVLGNREIRTDAESLEARRKRLPAPLLEIFEKRRAEMMQERKHGVAYGDDPGSLRIKKSRNMVRIIDRAVYIVVFSLIALMLWVEYDINILESVWDIIMWCLDPGLPPKSGAFSASEPTYRSGTNL